MHLFIYLSIFSFIQLILLRTVNRDILQTSSAAEKQIFDCGVLFIVNIKTQIYSIGVVTLSIKFSSSTGIAIPSDVIATGWKLGLSNHFGAIQSLTH